MMNAVYHSNEGKGSIFEKYDLSTFTQTTLQEGIVYNDTSRLISINLKTNVLDNIEGKYTSLKDDKYVKDEDLTDLIDKLNNEGKFRIQIDDINIGALLNEVMPSIEYKINL